MLNVIISQNVCNFVLQQENEVEAIEALRVELLVDFLEITKGEEVDLTAEQEADLELINSTIDTVEYIEEFGAFELQQEVRAEMEYIAMDCLMAS